MTIERTLRVAFVIAIVTVSAFVASAAYLYAVARTGDFADYRQWADLMELASSGSAIAEFFVLLILAAAVYRLLGRPHAASRLSVFGLAIAGIGALCLVFPHTYQLAQFFPSVARLAWVVDAYLWLEVLSFFGLPVFLLGVGLMTLWAPIPPPAPLPPPPPGPLPEPATGPETMK